MTKIIKFSNPYGYIGIPKPAKKYIPNWYKNAENFIGGNPRINPSDGVTGAPTVKHCIPFLDSLTSGYIVELWQDIQIVRNDNGAEIHWGTYPDVVELRDERFLQGMPHPEGCSNTYAWKFPFALQTPPGYSVLITHPLNRHDLPFITTSGIADGDNGLVDGNAPFFLKDTFEGIIPMGTPIAQIIPFKRDNWESEENKELLLIREKFNARRVISGWYKRNQWHKKTYN